MDSAYYDWLMKYCSMIDDNYENPKYDTVMEVASRTIFVSNIPNDQNRVRDGLDLRELYSDSIGGTLDLSNSPELDGCTFLEFMVGMADRIEFMMGDSPNGTLDYWMVSFIKNLDLKTNSNAVYVQRRLEDFVGRKYDRNGSPGIFAVKNSSRDMRDTELWFQMMEYMEYIQR